MSQIRPGGRECELFNDQMFSELRAFAQVPDDFINDGFSLEALESGGGKGGELMARVGEAFIVKRLSKSDHETLLLLTSSYHQHSRSGDTMLCPIYLHFRDKESGQTFFAMRNSVGAGPFASLYDLKGCSDDKCLEKAGKPIKAVHKRIWKVSMWCGKVAWSEERNVYFRGKQEARKLELQMTVDQRNQCLKHIERDTAWLAQHRVMDYSLLVAIKDYSGGAASGGQGVSAQKPFLYRTADGEQRALYITIIDFLQLWTMGKRVARVLKCMECNKATVPPGMYAERFRRHFTHRMQALPAAQELDGSGGAKASRPPVTAVAPPAGDCEAEGQPEERLNGRPMPDEAAKADAPQADTPWPLSL